MKKFLSFILVLSIIISTGVFVSAKKVEGFSADTIITEDNLNSILSYYGLDPSTIVTNIDTSDTSPVSTVAELEQVLTYFSNTNNTSYCVEDETSLVEFNNLGNVVPLDLIVYGNRTLIQYNDVSTNWGLKTQCTGYYGINETARYKWWTGVSNPSVLLYSDPVPGIAYVLDSVNSIGASYTSSTITLSYSVTVKSYLAIVIGGIEILGVLLSTTNVSGNSYWGTSYIPNLW